MKSIISKIKNLVCKSSLRARIFLLIMVVGIIPVDLSRAVLVNIYEDRAVSRRISTVQNQLLVVADHLTNYGYISNYNSQEATFASSRAVVDAEIEMLADLYEGRAMIINRNFRIMSDTYDLTEGKTIISEEVIECFDGKSVSRYDRENGYIEMTTPIVVTRTIDGKSTTEIYGVMLTSISNSSIIEMKELLNRQALLMELLISIVIFLLALLLSSRISKPLNQITNAINDVKAGYTDDPISVSGYSETAHIVDAFNHLLTRMQALDESREEFVANVSHELKTPMTSIKVLADSLMSQPDAPAELYREFMEDITSQIDRENQIITDLLALVRLDRRSQDMNIALLDVTELAELIMKRLRPLARRRDVDLVLENRREIMAEVDEVKLSMVMSNLVENAIKYNVEHGWVHVCLDADHQNFTFTVSDSGIGMPEEDLAHIYERFYRVDKSHSREIGGTGLGLAITRSAVLMHHGDIKVTSQEGSGTTFVVTIPLKYIASR